MSESLDINTKNIIAISGTGRTGSTILSILLTQHPSVFNLGQLRDLWQSYDQGLTCSCGSKLSFCAVYSRVMSEWIGENPSRDLREMKQLMRAFFKDAAAHADWSNDATRDRLRENHHEFLSNLGRLLEILSIQRKVHHFVDASKSPEMSLAFSLIDGISLRVLNLVRDPRAVVCSWHQKKKGKIVQSSREWSQRQRILEHWGRHLGERFLQVSYETFAESPEETLTKILSWADFPQSDQRFIKPNQTVVSWDDQHLYPPANERVLGERKTDVLIAPAEAWKAARFWHVHCMALLFSYPDGVRYIRRAK